MDWNEVYNRKLKAPIKPKVKSDGDTRNIEGVFLNETIKNTPEN